MKRLPAIALIALLIATPALAQSPVKDRLARAGQAELVAGDGPTYRAVVGSGEVLLLQVAGDGRATLTLTDKSGKAERRSITNQQLDALDAALEASGFNGERPLTPASAETCKPDARKKSSSRPSSTVSYRAAVAMRRRATGQGARASAGPVSMWRAAILALATAATAHAAHAQSPRPSPTSSPSAAGCDDACAFAAAGKAFLKDHGEFLN